MIATVLTAINYSFSLLSRPTERRNACIGTTTLIFLVFITAMLAVFDENMGYIYYYIC